MIESRVYIALVWFCAVEKCLKQGVLCVTKKYCEINMENVLSQCIKSVHCNSMCKCISAINPLISVFQTLVFLFSTTTNVQGTPTGFFFIFQTLITLTFFGTPCMYLQSGHCRLKAVQSTYYICIWHSILAYIDSFCCWFLSRELQNLTSATFGNVF